MPSVHILDASPPHPPNIFYSCSSFVTFTLFSASSKSFSLIVIAFFYSGTVSETVTSNWKFSLFNECVFTHTVPLRSLTWCFEVWKWEREETKNFHAHESWKSCEKTRRENLGSGGKWNLSVKWNVRMLNAAWNENKSRLFLCCDPPVTRRLCEVM